MEAGQEPIEVEQQAAAVGETPTDPVCAFLLEHGRLKESDLRRATTYRDQHGGALAHHSPSTSIPCSKTMSVGMPASFSRSRSA